MKNIFTLAVLVFLTLSTIAQNQQNYNTKRHIVGKNKSLVKKDYSKADVILSENFESGAMPTGWTEDLGAATQGWSFNSDASSDFWTIPDHGIYACINDDDCNCDMSDVWLITDVIDLSENTGAFLNFEYIAPTWTDDICAVKASKDGGSTWEPVGTLSQTDYWKMQEYNITEYAGEANFKLAFYYSDNSNHDEDYGFAIDDIVIFEPLVHDLEIKSISPNLVLAGNSAKPKITIFNSSSSDEASWQVSVTDGESYNETISAANTILANTEQTLTFPDWTPTQGVYTLTATVTLENDQNPENNSLDSVCTVISIVYDKEAYGIKPESESFGSIEFSETSSSFSSIATSSSDPFPMASEFNGKAIYRVYENYDIGIVLPETGECMGMKRITNAPGSAEPVGLAWDWQNEIMYMVAVKPLSKDAYFGTLDLNSFVFTEISEKSDCKIIAIDMASDGYIYGPSVSNDKLYKIDPATGSFSSIGPTGFDMNYGQDVSFDAQTNKLYTIASTHDYGSFFGYYNLETGALTPISGISEQFATFTVTTDGSSVGTYKVFFNVTDNNNNPVKEAVINIDGVSETITTNLDGVAMAFLMNGNYSFIVTCQDYTEHTESFSVLNSNKDIDISLTYVSIKENNNKNISISPNPTNGKIKINSEGKYDVLVTDITGRLVCKTKVLNTANIDISDQEAGIYIVNFVNKKGNKSFKIIKE